MKHSLQNEKLTHARLAIRRQSFFVTVTGAEEASIRIFADFCAPTVVNCTLIDIYTKIRGIILHITRDKQSRNCYATFKRSGFTRTEYFTFPFPPS